MQLTSCCPSNGFAKVDTACGHGPFANTLIGEGGDEDHAESSRPRLHGVAAPAPPSEAFHLDIR